MLDIKSELRRAALRLRRRRKALYYNVYLDG